MGMLVNIEGYGQINFEDADSLEEIQTFVDTDPAFKTQLTEQGFGHLFERPDPGITGDIARGVDQLQAMFYGAGAAVGDIVGSEDLTDWGIEGYERNMAEASQNAAAVGTYKNIKDIGDAGRYAVEAIFENLPMFLPSLATGGVGAFVARKAAERAVKSSIASIVEKKVAQGWTQEAAEKLGQHAGGKMILDNFKKQATKQAQKQTAGVVPKATKRGAAIGAYAGALPMTTGEVTGSVYDATGEIHGGLGLAGGAISASFEMLPNVMFLSNVLGKDVANNLTRGLIKRVGVGTAKGMLAEGPTEVAQSLVEHVATNIADPSIDIFSPDHTDELIDSFLKGAAAGGGIGATSSFIGGILNRETGPEDTEVEIDGTLVDISTLMRDEPDSGRKIKMGEMEGTYAGSFTDSNDKTTKVGLFGQRLLPIYGTFEFLPDEEETSTEVPESGGMETRVDEEGNPIPLTIEEQVEALGNDINVKNWLRARGLTGWSSTNKAGRQRIAREELELEAEFGENVRLDLLNNTGIDLKHLYSLSADKVRQLLDPNFGKPEAYPQPTTEQQSEIDTLRNDILRNASREENAEGDLVYTLKRQTDVQALADYYENNIFVRRDAEGNIAETDRQAAQAQAKSDVQRLGIQDKPAKPRGDFDAKYRTNENRYADLQELYNLEQELSKGQFREYQTDETIASLTQAAQDRIAEARARLIELRRKFKRYKTPDWTSPTSYGVANNIMKNYAPADRAWGEVDPRFVEEEGLHSPTPQGPETAHSVETLAELEGIAANGLNPGTSVEPAENRIFSTGTFRIIFAGALEGVQKVREFAQDMPFTQTTATTPAANITRIEVDTSNLPRPPMSEAEFDLYFDEATAKLQELLGIADTESSEFWNAAYASEDPAVRGIVRQYERLSDKQFSDPPEIHDQNYDTKLRQIFGPNVEIVEVIPEEETEVEGKFATGDGFYGIEYVAFKYKGKIYKTPLGTLNHTDFMEQILGTDIDRKYLETGYITTDNEFVDRWEARGIAETAGQIRPNDAGAMLGFLISEDIKVSKKAAAPELFQDMERNPLAPHERYITNENGERVAVVNAELKGNNIHIHNLRALQPGGGSIGLGAVIDEALRRGTTISLFAEPFFANPGVQELNKTDLKEWYQKFGFKFEEGSDYGVRAARPIRDPQHSIGDTDIINPNNQYSRPLAHHGKATEAFAEAAPRIETQLRQLLDKMGLPNIALKVVRAIEKGQYRGRYHQKLIEVALNYENPESALKHEAIHALMDLGLFTKSELRTLRKHAKRWVNDFNIRDRYKDENLTEEELIEEAIAYKMEHYDTEKAETRTLLKRISDFFKALAEVLTGAEFRTPEDIFGSVMRGEIANRSWIHPRGGDMRLPSEAIMRNGTEQTFKRAKHAIASMSGGKETVTTDMSAFAKFTTDNRNQAAWDRDFARMWLPLDYIRRDFNILLDKAIHKLRALGRIKGNPAVWPEFIKAAEIAATMDGDYKRVPERWLSESWDGDRTIQDGDEIVFINGETPGIAKDSKLEANEVVILKGAAAQAWVDMQDGHNDILKAFKDSIIYHDRERIEKAVRLVKFNDINDPQYTLTWPDAQELQRQDFTEFREVLEGHTYGYEQDVRANEQQIKDLTEIIAFRKEQKQDFTEEQAYLDEAKQNQKALAAKAKDFADYYDAIDLAKKFEKELGMYDAMIERDYVPMGRFGSHFIAVYAQEDMVNGEPKAGAKAKYVEFYEKTPQEKMSNSIFVKNADARREALIAKFPEDHVSRVGAVSNDSLQGNLRGVGEQIDLLWATLNSEDRAVSKDIFKKFAAQLDDGKGTFFSNMRQREKVPGFEIENVHRSVGQYILSGAHVATRLKHKRDSDRGLNTFLANNGGKKGARRRQHAIETHDFILGPEESYQAMKQLGFVWYLGGNASTGLLQMMSMPQFAMFHLTKFTGGKKIGKVAAEMAKATADVAKGFVWGPKKVYDDIPFDPNKMRYRSEDERNFVLRAMAESITKQGSFMEESGISVNEHALGARAKAAQGWRSFMVKYMAAPFSTFETLSRTATALTAYRLAQDPKVRERADYVMKDDNLWQQELEDRGLDSADPFHIAKYVVNESFGQFGKENKSQMFRDGAGAVFQFQFYPMMMFQALGRMFLMQGSEGKKAFAGVMLMLLITAGMRGLPGADDSEKILRHVLKTTSGLDVDMGLILRQMLQDVEGGAYMADFMENGIFNAMGLSVQSRISMGQIPGIDIPLSLFGIQGNNADVLGLAGSYITSTQKTMQLLGEDRIAEAGSVFLPAFIRNGIKAAFVYPTEGVRTVSGTQLLTPEDIKWHHQAMQVIGFTPTVVSNARDREFALSQLGKAAQAKKKGYERRLEKHRYNNIKAAMDKDAAGVLEAQKKFAEIVKEVVEYNLHAAPEDKIIPNMANINKRVLGRLYPDLSRIGQVDKRHRSIAYKLYQEGSAYER